MPLYEIGLVSSYECPAVKIRGPYPTSQAAYQACEKINKDEGRSLKSGWSWMWAQVGEITRTRDCEIQDARHPEIKRDDSRDLAKMIDTATQLLIKNLYELIPSSAAQEQILHDAHQAMALCRTYLSDYVKLRNDSE